ncbi:membrane protein [Grimontia sp. AD028]|uniref:YoaK family protein n=1 Tax=Grimontia sp. AD028 TaxID=1581149 RepID=UPI00061B1381|nr:YoaK family protein [Grimontia sp. AD028]KKD58184.1 membrane protein [Grimontia sp. AD028]
MISKLPKWVEYGAFVLALTAGYVNGIGLLGFEHQAISHLSGTATLIGTDIINSHPVKLVHLLSILAGFFGGALLSGFILKDGTLSLGRRYDFLLIVEAALLLGAIYPMSHNAVYGLYLAAAACGIQNGLVTSYSGAIVRTTHITGIITDLGLMFGARLRGQPVNRRKLVLFVVITVGFVLGGTLSAMLFPILQEKAFVLPAMVCVTLAFIYRIYMRRARIHLKAIAPNQARD